jgi:hypothetical protein
MLSPSRLAALTAPALKAILPFPSAHMVAERYIYCGSAGSVEPGPRRSSSHRPSALASAPAPAVHAGQLPGRQLLARLPCSRGIAGLSMWPPPYPSVVQGLVPGTSVHSFPARPAPSRRLASGMPLRAAESEASGGSGACASSQAPADDGVAGAARSAPSEPSPSRAASSSAASTSSTGDSSAMGAAAAKGPRSASPATSLPPPLIISPVPLRVVVIGWMGCQKRYLKK